MKSAPWFALCLLAFTGACGRKAEAPADPRVVRCAVIGGMTMTGLWPEIARRFVAKAGYKIEVVATGPRAELDKAFREGKADLLAMHSGDITTDLVAEGFRVNMRPWTRIELCIVGPPDDPAGVRGLTNGAAALRQIAAAQARFVDFHGIGSRELSHNLWRQAGVDPKGDWVIRDDSVSKWNILQFARSNHACVVVGYIPARLGKLASEGMKILVKDDPTMRRPFIVMEANPARVPRANHDGAKALAATNGVAGGRYYVLSSANVALPLNQWSPVATNSLTASGAFSITVTNVANPDAPSQQFFIIQTQ